MILHLTPQDEQSAKSLYADATSLVQQLDRQGFNEMWITEHHFNPFSLCPSPLLLCSSFLAKTEQIKLGVAAILVGFHNPIDISEQLATLSALYPNRILSGFAKGGPFERQNAAYKMSGDVSREKMLEAVPAMLDLMSGKNSTHQGEFYNWEDLELTPKVEGEVPFFLASGDSSSIELAVKLNLGLMIAQFWPLEKAVSIIEEFEQLSNGRAPEVMAARGLFIGESRAQAEEIALEFIDDFRTKRGQIWVNKGPMSGNSTANLLDRMLVGTVEDVREKTQEVLRAGITRLAINPLVTPLEEKGKQAQLFFERCWSF